MVHEDELVAPEVHEAEVAMDDDWQSPNSHDDAEAEEGDVAPCKSIELPNESW